MKVIKKLLLAVILFIAATVAAFIVAGLVLPAEREFTNEVEINAPAEKVWQVANDRAKYTEWQTNLTRVEVVDDKNWIEYPKDSPEPLKFTLVKDNSPSDMEIRYTMGETFNGYWKGEIAPAASGVRLKTVDGYVSKGWVTKIMLYLFFDLDKFAKDWNSRFKDRVEKLNQ